MEDGKYSRELNVGVRVVHMACELCQRLQEHLLLSTGLDQVRSKDDDSLVTVADWSVQATVSWMLSQNLGDQSISIVAEEDSQTLSKPESAALLAMVVDAVNECLSEAPRFGLQGPNKALEASEILDAISQCNSNGGSLGRHWVLDPVDGTLGFVRGDQYAVALAMIDDGEVVVGILGCPNYPVKDDGLNLYSPQNNARTETSSREVGCLMYAQKHGGKAWMQPLIQGDKWLEWPNSAKLIRVSSIDDPAQATFCEPVEGSNSDHAFAAGVANSVGKETPSCSQHG